MKLTRRLLKPWGLRLRRDDPHHHPRAAKRWLADPDNLCLISFPRTGSHWLRMIIELYFDRPLLVRTFYHPGRRDYLLLHDHDMDLQLACRNVLYLYRDPVDTVFSQLGYYRQSIDDAHAIVHWASRYALHVAHWLIERRPHTRMTVLRYEAMRSDLAGAFGPLVEHIGGTLDAARLARCADRVTRSEVKQKTTHQEAVMTLGEDYEARRRRFREEQASRVWDAVRAISSLTYRDPQRLAELWT